MGLYIVLMRKTTGSSLSRCPRTDTQISISIRMTVSNKSNNDAWVGLIFFQWWCSVLVRRCMFSGNAKNPRGHFLLSSRPYPMFLVKLRGVVMFLEISGVFVNDVKNVFSC